MSLVKGGWTAYWRYRRSASQASFVSLTHTSVTVIGIELWSPLFLSAAPINGWGCNLSHQFRRCQKQSACLRHSQSHSVVLVSLVFELLFLRRAITTFSLPLCYQTTNSVVALTDCLTCMMLCSIFPGCLLHTVWGNPLKQSVGGIWGWYDVKSQSANDQTAAGRVVKFNLIFLQLLSVGRDSIWFQPSQTTSNPVMYQHT